MKRAERALCITIKVGVNVKSSPACLLAYLSCFAAQ